MPPTNSLLRITQLVRALAMSVNKRSSILIKTLPCLPSTMSRRLYLGSEIFWFCSWFFYWKTIGLPTDVHTEDVQKFFDGLGRIIDCRVMTGTFQWLIVFSYANLLIRFWVCWIWKSESKETLNNLPALSCLTWPRMPKRLFRLVMANPFWVLSESTVWFHQSRLR